MNNNQSTKIIVTAGATAESIDQVRYLSNRSSGKLGTLIAQSAAIYGYETTLLVGPNCITPTSHPRLSIVEFSSTRDLGSKLQEHWPSNNILIMAAAVSDFTPKGGQLTGKIRRSEHLHLDLMPTDDLVQGIASKARDDQNIIAFALADSGSLEKIALEKMKRKGVDAIVANPIETMEAKNISVTVFCKDGRKLEPQQEIPKSKFAKWIIENLDEILTTT
jgi:phosphopantothenoylcysteine decarboxylase/phosphopantothenate--cysteine ligase